MVRCPFSGAGRKTAALRACPGFQPDEVPVTLTYASPEATDGVLSCRHLMAVANGRGFMPGCAHPGGIPVTPAQAADIIATARRREAALAG